MANVLPASDAGSLICDVDAASRCVLRVDSSGLSDRRSGTAPRQFPDEHVALNSAVQVWGPELSVLKNRAEGCGVTTEAGGVERTTLSGRLSPAVHGSWLPKLWAFPQELPVAFSGHSQPLRGSLPTALSFENTIPAAAAALSAFIETLRI
jgi:hypothetical protein